MVDDTARFFRRVGARFVRPLRHAAGLLGRMAKYANLPESEQHRINAAVGALFLAVLQADGRETPEETEQLDGLFNANFGKREAARIRESLAGVSAIDLDECARVLLPLERIESLDLVRGMLEIGYADDELTTSELTVIQNAARGLGIDDDTLEQCRLQVLGERGQRTALVKSGAGILVALVVIGVFVFTATFLKSVLFGLMLAYFVLPLQRWFQFRFFPNPIVQRALAVAHNVGQPFRRLGRAIKSRFSPSRASQAACEHEKRVTQACHATLATLVVATLLIGGSLGWASSRYVASLQPTTDLQATASEPATDKERLAAPPLPGVPWLERYRPVLERSSFLRLSSEIVKEYLTDDAKKKELLGMVVHNLQPLLLRAGGLLGMLANWLLDAMMTLFFFSFFLQKIAAGQSLERGREKPTSRYLVETIFASGWLPAAGVGAMREAHVILDEILAMLQTWVKGYLWIIIIESALYITAFAILGVPYFHVLGILAGLTVLLPFIGPIASFLLTLVVTFAFQSPSVTTLVAIVGVYVFCHAIIEQLILFPALIGEALGLNALETIIVVLLGGLVAGLAGAVFAIPVAAILKYLIPHIYHSVSQTLPSSATTPTP